MYIYTTFITKISGSEVYKTLIKLNLSSKLKGAEVDKETNSSKFYTSRLAIKSDPRLFFIFYVVFFSHPTSYGRNNFTHSSIRLMFLTEVSYLLRYFCMNKGEKLTRKRTKRKKCRTKYE